MDKVMRHIHFVRGTSSTQHRQLVAEPEKATYDDVLLHNDVRWLSKGNALSFCALLDEVKAFFKLTHTEVT